MWYKCYMILLRNYIPLDRMKYAYLRGIIGKKDWREVTDKYSL